MFHVCVFVCACVCVVSMEVFHFFFSSKYILDSLPCQQAQTGKKNKFFHCLLKDWRQVGPIVAFSFGPKFFEVANGIGILFILLWPKRAAPYRPDTHVTSSVKIETPPSLAHCCTFHF